MADRNRIQHFRAESGAFLVRLFSFCVTITRGANMTYKEWLSNWLANYVLPNYKPRTCERYTEKQLIPILRDMKKRSNSSLVITDKGKIPSVRAYQRSFELLLCVCGD